MKDTISLIPTYSQDGSVVTLIIDKLDGKYLTANELADALHSYAELLREPSDGELAN